MEFIVPSCICGYHVYGEIWTASLGKHEHEIGNASDRYAVAVKNASSVIVGHLPKSHGLSYYSPTQ